MDYLAKDGFTLELVDFAEGRLVYRERAIASALKLSEYTKEIPFLSLKEYENCLEQFRAEGRILLPLRGQFFSFKTEDGKEVWVQDYAVIAP